MCCGLKGSDEMSRPVRVYIAGPYSKGDTAMNVRTAIMAASGLMDRGFAPFVPHLTHLWHMVSPRPYEDWMKLDSQFLPCCDILLRLPGESPGADAEVGVAQEMDIPVYFDDIPLWVISSCGGD